MSEYANRPIRADLLADEAAYRRIARATAEEARSWAAFDRMVLKRMEELQDELGAKEEKA